MSARRKLVLATLKQLNCARMSKLVRRRLLQREEDTEIARHFDRIDEIAAQKHVNDREVKSLHDRLRYEYESNLDLLEPARKGDESDDGDDSSS